MDSPPALAAPRIVHTARAGPDRANAGARRPTPRPSATWTLAGENIPREPPRAGAAPPSNTSMRAADSA